MIIREVPEAQVVETILKVIREIPEAGPVMSGPSL